ncbi:GDSL-type esterase/lipase family protein [Thalassotalea sp. HSM 43]|uniref:GDSL-type esterase/lipase family protein n=1 Tax=Thalassotalea sp. HSM 43 TaxID=2552945 RepID=UPI001E2F5789|nr:GDSL-type esterase/lipase family protein [Thalassotalea sp. HSM 43]
MLDIVMIGSSIFEFWGTPKWSSLAVSNNAIRSTVSADWLQADLTKLPEARHIIVYCGSNDLVFGNDTLHIINNVQRLLKQLKTTFPATHIGYFSIIKCPQKQAAKQLGVIDEINGRIKDFCGNQYRYFEFNDFITNDPKWFVDDGLHLTEQAYAMLDTKIAPILQQWRNDLANK